MIEPLSC